MTQVVVFGAASIAEIVHYYLTHDSAFEVAAFTVDHGHLATDSFLGLPVVPFDELPRRYPPGQYAMFVAIGYSRMNRVREERYRLAKAAGYEMITYVSTKATVWPDSLIGDNCFIMENVIVHPFARVGNDVILWSGSHIGHGTSIGDHCFISSRTAISGNVTVEPNCFFGTNSTVRDYLTIGRESVVGAGAVVLKSTQPRGVYVAANARLMSTPSDRLPNL